MATGSSVAITLKPCSTGPAIFARAFLLGISCLLREAQVQRGGLGLGV